MSDKVIAPLVAVNGADGRVKYLYHGTTVPSDVSEDDLKRLRADGLVEKFAEPETESATGDGAALERPTESGPGSALEKWVAYAAAHEVEHAPEATKAEIVAAVTAAGK